MKRTDQVDWRERGSIVQVLGFAEDHGSDRMDFLRDYLYELMRLCLDHGFDFSILAAQSAHETADWTSPMWKQKGNPAGIGVLGVEGGAVGPNLSLTYANGVDAARAHVTHFYVYSRGAVPAGHELAAYIPLDPRYDAALKAFPNTIDTLDDFNVNGRWAVVSKPPYYGDRIISKGREIFADQEQTITTPGVTPAPTEPQPIPDVPGSWQGWFDLMFGRGKWTITQEWANDPKGSAYDDLYRYGAGHGLDGQGHPGIDVGLKYNTPMYAPAPATVVCAGTGVGPGAPGGGCAAYNDTGDKGPGSPKLGVGRIELYFAEKRSSLIFGHSRTVAVAAGQKVSTRAQIGGSGGMYGAHCHLEAVRWGTSQSYTYINPRILLGELGQVSPPTPTTPPPSGGSMALVTSSRPTTLPMRKVPPPPIVYAMVTKYEHQGSKYGYIYSPTNRQNIAVMHHETQGRGSIQFYQSFFSCPTGERCGNAMVDFVIQRDGQIGMLNNPFGHWAGWANGGGSTLPGGLERHGTQFVASRGISAVDFKTVSVEYEKTSSENMTDAQVQSGGHLAAWIHDLDDQPWDTHPFVPKYNCHCSLLHYWIGTTNCGKEEEDDLARVQAVTKGIMKQYQQGGGGEPEPPDVDPPPDPVSEIPGGLTLAEAKKRFGTLTRHNVTTGKVDRGIGFDPKGTISLGWAHRAATENVWPKAENWYVLLDSGSRLDLITFENDWRMASAGERSGMQWVELMPTTEAT